MTQTAGMASFIIYCLALGVSIAACGGADEFHYADDVVGHELQAATYAPMIVGEPPFMETRPIVAEEAPASEVVETVETAAPTAETAAPTAETVVMEPLEIAPADPGPIVVEWPRFERMLPLPIGACDHIPAEGACVGDVFETCMDGVPVGFDCFDDEQTCGYSAELDSFGCISHGEAAAQRAEGGLIVRDTLLSVMPFEPYTDSYFDADCVDELLNADPEMPCAFTSCEVPFPLSPEDGELPADGLVVAHHPRSGTIARVVVRNEEDDEDCDAIVEGILVRNGRMVARHRFPTSPCSAEEDWDGIDLQEAYWSWTRRLMTRGYVAPTNLITHAAEGAGDGATITTPLVVLDAPYHGHMIHLEPSDDSVVAWWVMPDATSRRWLARIPLDSFCDDDIYDEDDEDEVWCTSESASLSGVYVLGGGKLLLTGSTDGPTCHDPGADWNRIVDLPRGL